MSANIENTLQTILEQIHRKEGGNSGQKAHTAEEIAQIFLGSSDELSKKEAAALFKADFEDLDLRLQAVNARWQLQYYRPIECYRRLSKKLVIFTKRVIRRMLKFLIEPLVEEQMQFNMATTQALNSMREHSAVFQSATDYLLQKEREGDVALARVRAQVRGIADSLAPDACLSIVDYLKLQEITRGSIEDVKKGQLQYLQYFESCSRVLDLGCGRGEFLENLRDHGINGIGVDCYVKAATFCRSRGLNAVDEDAIEFLRRQQGCSADGVFSAQMIEYLPPSKALRLCAESYRVMKSGSYIVLETANPTSLLMQTKSLCADSSRKNPIHPKLLEYYLQESGFRNIQILFPQNKDSCRLPLLEAEHCANLAEFNEGVNLLSDIIFGSLDYAIVAQK